jgi:hypothetical protein
MLTDEIKKIIRNHSSSPMTGLVEAVEQTRQNALAAEIQELIERREYKAFEAGCKGHGNFIFDHIFFEDYQSSPDYGEVKQVSPMVTPLLADIRVITDEYRDANNIK